MPSNPISLTEAIELVKDPENLDDPRLQDFIGRVEDMAISILREKDDSYLAGAVSSTYIYSYRYYSRSGPKNQTSMGHSDG